MEKLGHQHYLAWRKLLCLLILLCSLNISSSIAQDCLSVDCNNLQDLNLQCDFDIPLPDVQLITVLESCGTVSINPTDNFTATGTGCIGSTIVLERTYTIVDDLGTSDTSDDETATCVQLIMVEDAVAPVFTNQPQNVTFEYGSDVETQFNDWVSYNGYAQVFEDCQAYDWITDPVSPEIQYGACACTGSGTVMFSAVDQCGNAVSSTATFFVEDTTMPIITVQASDLILECNGGDYSAAFQAWLESNGGAEATDACSVSWMTNPAEPEIISFCGGTTTVPVSFIAYDDCGNEASTSAQFRVVDTQQPTWGFVPEDLTISCNDSVVFGTPEASDICSNVVIEHTDTETAGTNCDGNMTFTRTWTVRDACQMTTAEVSQTITVLDQQAPVLNAVHPLLVGLSNYDTLTFDCGNVTAFAATDFIATDDCSSNLQVTMTDPVLSGPDCIDGVQQQLLCTWTASDDCGNEGEFNIIINIVDNNAPVIASMPQDMTLSCGGEIVFDEPTATDDCDANLIIDVVDTETGSGCTFSYTRTWTFSDACGNEAMADQTIVLVDSTSPVFTSAPADELISCGDDIVFGMPVAEDDCSQVTISSEDTVEESSACVTSHTRTWTASDECGNQSTTAQTITVSDTIAPEFTVVPIDETISCGTDPIFGEVEVFDACGDVTIAMNDTVVQDSCVTTYTRTWTATDACGLTASATQMITAIDDVAPVFSMIPVDKTIGCSEPVVFDEPMATDNCTEVMVDVENISGNGNCNEPYTRIWTATDQCGMSTTVSQTIFVQDNDPPIITFTPPDTTISCDAVPNFGEIEAVDFCSAATIVAVDTTIAMDCIVMHTRTWTVNDACGNISTAVQTITQNNMSPVFGFVPEDEVIGCGNDPVFGNPQVTDDCGTASVTFVDSEMADTCGISYTRTWTAMDNCGNVTTAAQTISAMDETAPVFDFTPQDQDLPCNGSIEFGEPVVSDDCGVPTVTFVDSPLEGDAFNGFSQTRTWTLADDCGNTAAATQTISVDGDSEAPVFTYVPEPPTFTCGDSIIIDDPIAVDDCSGVMITYSEVDNGGNCVWGIDVTRTWIATDAAGNTAEVSITYWIVPENAPMFFEFIPDSYTSNACDQAPQFGVPIPVNNCTLGDIMMTHEDEVMDGVCSSSYAVTRTWTATDNCGALATCSQTVTIEDIEAPVFMTPPTAVEITCGDSMLIADPMIMDNCNGGVELSYEDVSIVLECDEVITRTWTASDDCGNVRTAVQMITIVDDVNPEFTFVPEGMEVTCGEEELVFGTPQYSDNCSAVSITFVDMTTPGDCTTGYDATRTWTIMDACGNENIASQTITVLVPATGIQFDNEPTSYFISCGNPVAFDNVVAQTTCDGSVLLNVVDDVSNMGCEVIHTRTWMATDNCGNQKMVSQSITVVDDEAPFFTGVPEDATISCQEIVEFGFAAARDICNSVDMSFEDAEEIAPCESVYTRTWTATDGCGNVITVAQRITVVTDAIVFDYVPEDEVVACDEVYEFEEPTLQGHCSEVTLDFEDEEFSGDVGGEYRIVRTWRAIDACGNEATAIQVVEFVDNQAPNFLVVPTEPIQISVREWNRNWEPGLFVQDNCSSVTVEGPQLSRSSVCNGIMMTYTYTARDEAGNSTEQVYMVNVIMRPDWHCGDDELIAVPESFEEVEDLDLLDFEIADMDTSFDPEVKIHPNPAVDKVFVSYYSQSNDNNTEIAIYNVMGQELHRQKAVSVKGHNSIDLNLVHFPNGNYLVRIKVGDQLSTKKLLITKE